MDHYLRLGVPYDATSDQIRAAYRELAKRWHPDCNPDNRAACEEILKRINEAYHVLSHPIRRGQYDAEILRPTQVAEQRVQEDVLRVAVDGLDDIFDGPSLDPEGN
jgi:curved DNA-binding protein CbpA